MILLPSYFTLGWPAGLYTKLGAPAPCAAQSCAPLVVKQAGLERTELVLGTGGSREASLLLLLLPQAP